MEFILILGIFYADGVAATSILFPSREACETARKQAVEEFTISAFSRGSSRARALCVPRSQP